jgi:hypothetical protein
MPAKLADGLELRDVLLYIISTKCRNEVRDKPLKFVPPLHFLLKKDLCKEDFD